MAASGYTPIILFNSGTASNVPTTGNLAVGELAINYADGKLYYNTGSAIKVLAGAGGAGIAGGSNTQVQYNSSGSLAGSANLTFDGTNLGLSGGTANGVAYLNGSKVLTTGSALTFDGTNLGVGGAALSLPAGYTVSQVSGTSGAGLFRATSTSVDIRFQADQVGSVGLINVASNHPLAFNVNATEQMRLTSTGLGIGTSSPISKLNVNGGTGDTTATDAVFSLTRTTSTGNVESIKLVNTEKDTNYGNFVVQIKTTPSGSESPSYYTNALTLDGQYGNLGLGVTPSAWALGKAVEVGFGGNAVWGNATSSVFLTQNMYYDGNFRYKNTAAASNYQQNSGVHSWYVAPSGTAGNAISFAQAMTLDNSGRLLLGATSGTTGQLIISSNGATQNSISFVDINGAGRTFVTGPGVGTGNVGDFGFYDYTASQVGYIYTGGNSGKWAWYTAGAERARIDSSGNLLVGATTSLQTSIGNGVVLNPNSSGGFINIGHTSSSSGYGYAQFLYGSSATVIGSITQNGTTGVLYNISSDQRLKENIVDAPSADVDIDAIKVRSFDFISDKSNVKYGFIAQELVTVAPYAVHQPENPEEMMGVDYSKLVPMLVKEVQSLRARLKAANIA